MVEILASGSQYENLYWFHWLWNFCSISFNSENVLVNGDICITGYTFMVKDVIALFDAILLNRYSGVILKIAERGYVNFGIN